MSVEQAKAFIEKLDSDKTLLTQVAGAASDETRLELARAAGFEFATEDLADAIGESDREELSDDDLEAVAGGGLEYDNNHTGPKLSFFRDLQKKYTEVEWTY